jgi:heme a synthase
MENSATKPHKAVITWLLSGCVLIYVMVLVGGLTRLTHSGLSMVEWSPGGSLPPLNEAEWEASFGKYKTSPEYRLVNRDFTLQDYKRIFWWEYIHRVRFYPAFPLVPRA